MQKIIAAVLMLTFTVHTCFAIEIDEVDVFNGFELTADEPIVCDLDGDGTDELLACGLTPYDDRITSEAVINIENSGGVISWSRELWNAKAYVCDLDEDGVTEIFVTGEDSPCNYSTYCLHYTGETIEELMFENPHFGMYENEVGYCEGCCGLIAEICDGRIVLRSMENILGTYVGDREYGLSDGILKAVDNGMWRILHDVNSPDTWKYYSLPASTEIPAVLFGEDGEYDGVIAEGESVLLVASDLISIVYFVTEDYRTGCFTVEQNENGLGSLVNGMPEAEVFGRLPYTN